MKKVLYSLIASAAFVTYACDSSQQGTDSKEMAEEQNEAVTDSDDGEDMAEFMVDAADGGMMEVELGKLAEQKASNAQVKEFGKMMVSDHTNANDELKQLAAQNNITLPTTLSQEKQKKVDELSALSGSEFDEQYIEFMIKDHKEDVDEFEEASQEVTNPAIKGFATKTLPVLQQHLQQAEQLNSSLSGTARDTITVQEDNQ